MWGDDVKWTTEDGEEITSPDYGKRCGGCDDRIRPDGSCSCN